MEPAETRDPRPCGENFILVSFLTSPRVTEKQPDALASREVTSKSDLTPRDHTANSKPLCQVRTVCSCQKF
jgi:hypothetical protein